MPHLAFQPQELADTPVLDMEDVVTSYYLRIQVADEPGVIAQVSGILGGKGISIEALQQKEPGEGEERVDIVMLTHLALEKNVEAAITRIERLRTVVGKVTRIRLEELL